MKNWVNIFVTVFLAFSLGSCGITNKNHTSKIIKPKSTKKLLEQLNKNEFHNDWVSFKANVAFKSEKMSDSFKMNFRIKKDSAIWVSATYYSVEVARLLITKDTVKFMDRKAKQFFIGRFSYINERFSIDADFESLQAILLGNSIGILDGEKVKSYIKKKQYQLSSIGRRKIKKADKKIEKEKENKIKTDFAYTIALNPETYKVEKLNILHYSSSQFLNVEYNSHQKINNILFPEKYHLIINSEKMATADITYSKVAIDKKVKFSFNIPSKYVEIE